MSESKAQRVAAVHRLNAGANLGLGGVKITVGLLAGSPALVAHGFENLADLLSLGLAWIGHHLGQRPPDEDHHYGHGNSEAVAAIGIGIVILVAGGTIVWRTLATGSRAAPGLEGWLALCTAIASGLVCEGVSRRTGRVGRELGSQLLTTLARDKRSDALTSLVVVAGVGGSLAGVSWAEPPVAVLMGAWIAILGGRSVLEGFDVLMDRVADPRLRGELKSIAEAVPGVRQVQAVRVHPIGSSFLVDLEVSVDGELSVHDGHEIAHAVERDILTRRDQVARVQVHVNPA